MTDLPLIPGVSLSPHGELHYLLRALVARAERLGEELAVTPEDLEAARELDVEIERIEHGSGPRTILRRREDPRRARIRAGLGRTLGEGLGEDIVDAILEELDRA